MSTIPCPVMNDARNTAIRNLLNSPASPAAYVALLSAFPHLTPKFFCAAFGVGEWANFTNWRYRGLPGYAVQHVLNLAERPNYTVPYHVCVLTWNRFAAGHNAAKPGSIATKQYTAPHLVAPTPERETEQRETKRQAPKLSLDAQLLLSTSSLLGAMFTEGVRVLHRTLEADRRSLTKRQIRTAVHRLTFLRFLAASPKDHDRLARIFLEIQCPTSP